MIGFTCGAFDLLHPGHILLLKFAKDRCDHLIVGLHTDPSIDRPDTKRRPVQTSMERFIQLDACKYVDEIIVYDTERDLYNYLSMGHVNIRFLGDDYRGRKFTGDDLNIPISYIPRLHDYSSTAFVKACAATGAINV